MSDLHDDLYAALAPFLRQDGELDWQDQALCNQTDPEAFFPAKGGSAAKARDICAACPVAAECLEYALKNNERFGIWGGVAERDRRKLKKKGTAA